MDSLFLGCIGYPDNQLNNNSKGNHSNNYNHVYTWPALTPEQVCARNSELSHLAVTTARPGACYLCLVDERNGIRIAGSPDVTARRYRVRTQGLVYLPRPQEQPELSILPTPVCLIITLTVIMPGAFQI